MTRNRFAIAILLFALTLPGLPTSAQQAQLQPKNSNDPIERIKDEGMSFDAIGLPGFQFIQDQIEYDSRTHHSNMDVFDRIQADDMKQAATIMSAFLYNTAMRDEKLPRKAQAAK